MNSIPVETHFMIEPVRKSNLSLLLIPTKQNPTLHLANECGFWRIPRRREVSRSSAGGTPVGRVGQMSGLGMQGNYLGYEML